MATQSFLNHEDDPLAFCGHDFFRAIPTQPVETAFSAIDSAKLMVSNDVSQFIRLQHYHAVAD